MDLKKTLTTVFLPPFLENQSQTEQTGRVRLGLTPVQFCKECVASQLHSRTTIASYMIRNPASCITLRINMPCTFQNIEGHMKHALRQTQSSWNHVKSLAPHHCPIAGSSFCQKLSAVALLVPPAGLPSPALRDLRLQKSEKCLPLENRLSLSGLGKLWLSWKPIKAWSNAVYFCSQSAF